MPTVQTGRPSRPILDQPPAPDTSERSSKTGIPFEMPVCNGVFRADSVLAKHDENYMPPDAQRSLDQAKKTQGAPQP